MSFTSRCRRKILQIQDLLPKKDPQYIYWSCAIFSEDVGLEFPSPVLPNNKLTTQKKT